MRNSYNDGKIVYIVNEEKRTVVAMIRGFQRELRKLYARYGMGSSYEWNGDLSPVCRKIERLPNIYRSVVKCDLRDNFDVEIGKKKAKERLLLKLNLARENFLFDIYREGLDRLATASDKLTEISDRNNITLMVRDTKLKKGE